MAIPLILAGGAALFGAKKAYDAKKDNNQARGILSDAEHYYNRAKDNVVNMNEQAMGSLERLGETKIKAWDGSIKRFIEVTERTNKVDSNGELNLDGELLDKISLGDIGDMRTACNNASEIIAGGATSLGTGALVSVAAYGGTALLGTASTGTAIATLTGVTATNATLASLGGGSLAAGGLGIAGGTLALGGLVLGPVLAVGGVLAASKARNNLAEAKEKSAEASIATEKLNKATSQMKAIRDLTDQYEEFVSKYDERLNSDIDVLEKRLDENELVKESSILEIMHICALDNLNTKVVKSQKTTLFLLKNFFLKLVGKGIEVKTLEILIKDYLETADGVLDLDEIEQIVVEKLGKELKVSYPTLDELMEKIETNEAGVNYINIYNHVCEKYQLQLNYSHLDIGKDVLNHKLDEIEISNENRKISYEELDSETRQRMHLVYTSAQVLKELLNKSLLGEDGALNPESQELLESLA